MHEHGTSKMTNTERTQYIYITDQYPDYHARTHTRMHARTHARTHTYIHGQDITHDYMFKPLLVKFVCNFVKDEELQRMRSYKVILAPYCCTMVFNSLVQIKKSELEKQDVMQVLCLPPTTSSLPTNAFVHPYFAPYVVFISLKLFLKTNSIPIYIFYVQILDIPIVHVISV